MTGTTQNVNGVEATYKNAVASALNAGALKAGDVLEDCGHAPVDHATQAALENSSLTGRRFETAYNELFQTTHYLMNVRGMDAPETAEQLERVRHELLRVTYEN